MSITPTNENKNSVSVTNETKTGQSTTFAQHVETWGETGPAGDTFDYPGTPVATESKNSVTVTNESKT